MFDHFVILVLKRLKAILETPIQVASSDMFCNVFREGRCVCGGGGGKGGVWGGIERKYV